MRIPEEKVNEILELIMADIFFKTDDRHQTPDARCSENNRINTKSPTPRHITSRLQKIKDKEKILKEAREKEHLTYREK